jgi:hypothetical protein
MISLAVWMNIAGRRDQGSVKLQKISNKNMAAGSFCHFFWLIGLKNAC